MIIVSREQINKKLFKITEEEIRAKLSGDELTEALSLLPTDEEKQWMKIFQSTAPELARTQRKMGVCLDAEVTVLEDDMVKYKYADAEYEIKSPVNSFSILRAIEKDKSSAFEELSKQGCLKKEGKDVDLKTEPFDALNLMFKIADKFFFQIYLV